MCTGERGIQTLMTAGCMILAKTGIRRLSTLPQSLSLEWGSWGKINVGVAKLCFTGPTLCSSPSPGPQVGYTYSQWLAETSHWPHRKSPAWAGSDCYRKTPLNEWFKWQVFLTVLKAEVPTIKLLADSPCEEKAFFLICRQPPSCCILTWARKRERERESIFLVPFLKRALIPLTRAPPSWPNYLPNVLPPNTLTLGSRVSA